MFEEVQRRAFGLVLVQLTQLDWLMNPIVDSADACKIMIRVIGHKSKLLRSSLLSTHSRAMVEVNFLTHSFGLC